MTWPHEDVAALNAFYGDPRGRNGKVNPIWFAKNTCLWHPPYPLFYSGDPREPMEHLEVHVKAKDAFDTAFKDVLATLGHDYIVAHRLNVTGGLFCYRLERGGSRLSVHSWAIAIDIDPQHNPFPHPYSGPPMVDLKFAQILQKHGFCWRGASGDIDPMHFQLAHH